MLWRTETDIRMRQQLTGPYLPAIYKIILWCLLQDFVNFESNTTSDWLDRLVQPIRRSFICEVTIWAI